MKQYSLSTENAFSVQDIISQELLILNNLQWDINLPNFSTWINHCTLNWDLFIENIDSIENDFGFNLDFLRIFKFKDQNALSFNLYRSLTQYIDIICYDVEYLCFREKYITTSVIFLLLLKFFELVDFNQIAFLQLENIEHIPGIISFFNKYLNIFYKIEFVNIFEHVQYVSCYMDSNLFFNNVEQYEEEV